MPYEYAVNATVSTWNDSIDIIPLVVGLGVMVACGIFIALLAYQPFFKWIWKKIGKIVYVIKSFIIGSAVYFGGRGIYAGVKAIAQIGSEYLTLTDMVTGLIYFVALTLLGVISLYIGSRIYQNYLMIKPKMELKEEQKAEMGLNK